MTRPMHQYAEIIIVRNFKTRRDELSALIHSPSDKGEPAIEDISKEYKYSRFTKQEAIGHLLALGFEPVGMSQYFFQPFALDGSGDKCEKETIAFKKQKTDW